MTVNEIISARMSREVDTVNEEVEASVDDRIKARLDAMQEEHWMNGAAEASQDPVRYSDSVRKAAEAARKKSNAENKKKFEADKK